MDSQVRAWRDEGKHLPPFMRDFHDAKELFKSIDQYIVCEDGHPANQVNWIQAQCYTIDVVHGPARLYTPEKPHQAAF